MALTLATAMQGIVRSGARAFIPFLTGGYPDPTTFAALLQASRRADFIEVGLPFSDPVADGRRFARFGCGASGWDERGSLFELLAAQRDLPPLILMTYLNPVLTFGPRRFMHEAAKVGVRGIILTDLPPEDGEELFAEAASHDIASVLLVAPTTSDARIAAIASRTTGFVYCIAVKGTTGARQEVGELAERTVGRVRSVSAQPVVVGFGISTPEHVRSMCRFADGVVVGSALVDLIREHGVSENLPQHFEARVNALTAAAHTG